MSSLYKYTFINVIDSVKLPSMYSKPVITDKSFAVFDKKAEAAALNKPAMDNTDEILKAQEEAKRIITDANSKADMILASAQKQAQVLADKIRSEAYQSGYDEGRKAAEVQMSQKICELSNLLKRIDDEKADIINSFKDDVKFLAFDIAQKIVGDVVNRNDEALLSLYKNAIRGISNLDNVKIKVGEKQYDFMTSNVDRLLEITKGAKNIEIFKDNSAEPGTLIVETPEIVADASVGTQFRRILDIFRNSNDDAD